MKFEKMLVNIVNTALLFLILLSGIKSSHLVVSKDIQKIAISTNNLGLDILKKIPHYRNALISPLSISMLMGLLYTGTKNKTAEEIRSALMFSPSVTEALKGILDSVKSPEVKTTAPAKYQLEMANAVLVDESFHIIPFYKEQSRAYFDAAVESVSFALQPEEAFKSVNDFVAYKTNKKILKLLEKPMDPLTKLFLMNVVYFQGKWKTRFDQRLTTPDTFYNEGLVPKTVPMMRQKRKLRYGFDSSIQGQLIELPYSGNRFRMLILLPERRDGLQDILSALTPTIVQELPLILRETMVQVTLPRFSIESHLDLVPVLKRLGIRALFDGRESDLGGISMDPGLFVSTALHACGLQVSEDGSEASAATGLSAGVRTRGPLFTADHPFVFWIRDLHLNLTLFIGRVTHL